MTHPDYAPLVRAMTALLALEGEPLRLVAGTAHVLADPATSAPLRAFVLETLREVLTALDVDIGQNA